MKRCLNCRQTYEEGIEECPFCGYKPRTKNIVTRKYEIPTKTTTTTPKNVYASSSHTGAFYLKSGEKLNDRYSITGVIGYGAFGVAYECFDKIQKTNVVVKEYMPSHLVTRSKNGRDVEAFSEDASVKFTAGKNAFIEENTKLFENNIECVPELIECFQQNNTSYAVTQLIEAESLSSLITRKGKISYETTISLITSVLQGLRRLNKLGIIHGDICPENIIVVSEERTFLLDYNLSDFNRNVYTQRESGKPRPGYSALELYYKDMEMGPWTDVYAAAAVMYKMLTGMVLPNAIKRSSEDTVQPLSKLGVPISPGAEEGLIKALKVDYKKRTQSPEIFLNSFFGDEFSNIRAEKKQSAPKSSYTTPTRKQTPVQQNDFGSTFLTGILVFLTLSIIAVVLWFFISGVFPTPGFVSGFLGDNSDSPVTSETFKDENSKNEETSSQDNVFSVPESSSSNKSLDDIWSGIKSDIGDKVSSFIDDHITSSEGVSSQNEYYESQPTWEEETSSYYEDNDYYDDDENYYDDYNEDENNEYYTESVPEENTTSSEDSHGYDIPIPSIPEDAADYINSLIDNFVN